MGKVSREKQKAKRVESLKDNIDSLRDQLDDDIDSDDKSLSLKALAVKIIDETYSRVGNRESVKDRSHYGISQLEPRHISFNNGKATLEYTGKKGVDQKKKIEDSDVVDKLKEVVEDKDSEECIFCWEKGNGEKRRVSPSDINDYLSDYDITSKDIRGFHANDVMKNKLEEIREENGSLPDDDDEREKQLKEEFREALDEVSEDIGHESSTLRNSYLVPHFEDEFIENGEPPSSFYKESVFEKNASRQKIARVIARIFRRERFDM
jgi:DNA topoisomerase-1